MNVLGITRGASFVLLGPFGCAYFVVHSYCIVVHHLVKTSAARRPKSKPYKAVFYLARGMCWHSDVFVALRRSCPPMMEGVMSMNNQLVSFWVKYIRSIFYQFCERLQVYSSIYIYRCFGDVFSIGVLFVSRDRAGEQPQTRPLYLRVCSR